MEENKANLWKSFITFQKEFKGLRPDGKNPFFKSNYITLDGILETVRPILSKNGLAVLQEATTNEEFNVTVKTILVHESGEYFETEKLTMKPSKVNDPQCLGSLITYAKRYQLGALLGICESVDDDGNKATFGDKTPQQPSNNHTPSGNNNAASNVSMSLEDAKAYTMSNGKFAGKTLEEIQQENPGYIKWLAASSNNANLKAAAELLAGGK